MTSYGPDQESQNRLRAKNIKYALRLAISVIARFDGFLELSPDEYNPKIEELRSFIREYFTVHEKAEAAIDASLMMKICRNIIDVAREDDSSQRLITEEQGSVVQ